MRGDGRERIPHASRLGLLVAAAVSILVGCGPTPSARAPQPIVLAAEEGPGLPVEGARFWADGEELGSSGPDGRLTASLSGPAGTRVRLSAACPPGFTPATTKRQLTLRQRAATQTERPLEMRITCRRLQQLAALVVRAAGARQARLPITVRGQKVGQTDGEGVAHVVLKARPGTTLRVTVDTSSLPDLRPASPTRTFQLGDEPEILLFDQEFTQARPRLRRRRPGPSRPPAAPAPAATRPYRLR